jgi:hypothetical protein
MSGSTLQAAGLASEIREFGSSRRSKDFFAPGGALTGAPRYGGVSKRRRLTTRDRVVVQPV